MNSYDSGRDRPAAKNEQEERLIQDVARMLTEWEDSAELAMDFAHRLIAHVRERTPK